MAVELDDTSWDASGSTRRDLYGTIPIFDMGLFLLHDAVLLYTDVLLCMLGAFVNAKHVTMIWRHVL